MTSAVRVGGERLYRKAHRGEEVETPEREVEVHRAELLERGGERAALRDRVLLGHLRPHPGRDPRATPTARSCAGRRSAPLASSDAGESWTPAEALAFLPRAPRSTPRRPTRSRHGRRDRRPPGARQTAGAGPPDARWQAVWPWRDARTRTLRPEVVLGVSIEVTRLPDAEPRPRHVAIGTFDGVHLGHQAVIEGADTVLTFDPHPLEILHPAALPKLIMPFGVKRDVIDGLGVDELVVIPFDKEFAALAAPRSFIEQVLIEQLGAESVSVGENFRFGAKAKGDPEMLAARDGVRDPGRAAGRGRRRDRLLDPDPGADRGRRRRARRSAASAPRSCSRARSSAATSAAASSASRPPTSSPTTASAIPGHGVYAAFANGFPAAVNVGVRPTFETGRGVLIETYLIDHDEDLYGENLRVAFVEPPARREALRRASRS